MCKFGDDWSHKILDFGLGEADKLLECRFAFIALITKQTPGQKKKKEKNRLVLALFEFSEECSG